MVFTLHRYVFRELFKVFLLAGLALTLILSLGIILQPVQKYGVGPRQVVHLMGYFVPVTLTFVLPVAALFAASLVYGRLASDNELDAGKASGISLLTLVYPGLALAIMVAIVSLILSFHVMPVFVHRAERSFKANAKQIVFRNIQRKGYYQLPADDKSLTYVYADRVDARSNTLAGVVIVKMDRGIINEVITARGATILFNPHRRFNEVQITAEDTYRMDAEGSYSLGLSSFTAEFGSLLRDRIKFKKLSEMKKIRDVDLMLFDPIAKLAGRVYGQLLAELLAQDIASKAAGGDENFYRLHSGAKFVEFKAADVSVSKKTEARVELSGAVRVNEYDVRTGQPLRTLRCRKAFLTVEGDELAPTLTLELDSPTWQRRGAPEQPAWGWMRLRGLIIPGEVEAQMNKFRTESGLQAKRLASQAVSLVEPHGDTLRYLQNRLHRRIRKTFAEIEAEMHSRLVFGVGCIPMIMIGIGLGIILKGGHLLSAFGVSCIPAAVLMVAILAGKNITKNLGAQSISGTSLMWAGFGVLVLLAVAIYYRLQRS